MPHRSMINLHSMRWSKISLAAGITLNRFIPPCNQIIDYYMRVQRVTSVDLAWPQKAKSDDYAATKGALGSNPSFCAMAWGREKKSIKTLCQNADWLLSKRQICVSQSSHFFFSPSQGWRFTTKEGIKQYYFRSIRFRLWFRVGNDHGILQLPASILITIFLLFMQQQKDAAALSPFRPKYLEFENGTATFFHSLRAKECRKHKTLIKPFRFFLSSAISDGTLFFPISRRKKVTVVVVFEITTSRVDH